MSYQVYFLQDEDDTLQFIQYLEKVDAVIWHEGAFRMPREMQAPIIRQMSSRMMRQYLVVPKVIADQNSNASNMIAENVAGVLFLICNKTDPESHTYNIGRIYYRSDTSNPHDAQIIAFYKKLKSHIRRTYSYRKRPMIYCAPSFEKNYEEGRYDAAQLGQLFIL